MAQFFFFHFSLEEHSLLLKFKELDKTIKLLGSERPHGPILLGWVVIRQIYLTERQSELAESESNITRKLGNMALQLNVFEFISQMLDIEPFCGDSVSTVSFLYAKLCCRVV